MLKLCILAALSAAALMTAVPLRAAGPVFPPVSGNNLEGRKFDLPAGFEGERNVVFVAFLRQQQDDIDLWMKNLGPVKGTPGLKVYELPTIYRMNRLQRSFLDRGMAMGIPSKEARETTITLYLDKEKFRKALDMPTEERIYVLLVDRKGSILWHTDGVYTPEKLESLRKALK